MSRRVEDLLARARATTARPPPPPPLGAVRARATRRSHKSLVLVLAAVMPLGAAATVATVSAVRAMRSVPEQARPHQALGADRSSRSAGRTSPPENTTNMQRPLPPAGRAVDEEGNPVRGAEPTRPKVANSPAQLVPSGHAHATGATQSKEVGGDVRLAGEPAHRREDVQATRHDASDPAGGRPDEAQPNPAEARHEHTQGLMDARISATTDTPAQTGATRTEQQGTAQTTRAAEATSEVRTSLADEATLLSEALLALRVRHDATGALAVLAKYRAQFPAGALAADITLVAVEANRLLDRPHQALLELETLAPFSGGRRVELLLLEAELAASLGRCEVARAAVSQPGVETHAARVDAIERACP